MSTNKELKRSVFVRISDAIGILHFIACNIIIFLGQITTYFDFLKVPYPGIEFVYRYIDLPAYTIFKNLAVHYRGDLFYTLLVAEFVVIISSIVYGALLGLLAKILASLFDI